MTFDILKYLCFGCSKCDGSGYTLYFHTMKHYGALVKGGYIHHYWYDKDRTITKYKTPIETIDYLERLVKITGYNIPRFIRAVLSKTMSSYVV